MDQDAANAGPRGIAVGRTLLFVGILLAGFAPPTEAADAKRPIAPDADVWRFEPQPVYEELAPQAEALLGEAPIPARLSDEQWSNDLDALVAHLRARVPYANAAYGVDLAARLENLKQSLPGLTRDQRVMKLFRLLNAPAPGTGHFRIRPMQRALGWRALPLRLYRFEDGVYVIAALDEELIGREVLAIDGVPMERVYERLSPYVSADNRYHRLRRTEEQLLRWANPLQAVGIAETLASIRITLASEAGTRTIEHVRSMRPGSERWRRFRSSIPVLEPDETWSPVAEYVDNREPFYRVQYDEPTNLLYLQFNTVHDESAFEAFSDRSIADLARQLRRIVESRPIAKFVVDLRTNTGGDFTRLSPLVELLTGHPKINRRGVLYTMISPVTFSAAGVLATTLERRSKTLFVGEPGGFSPNQWGEVVPFMLPESRITVHISYAYYAFDLPGTSRSFIAPDLYVPLTSDQYFDNRDRALEAVLEHEAEPIRAPALSDGQRSALVGRYRLSPIHIVEIDSKGHWLRMEISGQSFFPDLSAEGPEVFVETDLYPVSGNGLGTDIRDVFLHISDDGSLILDWKGTPYPILPTRPGETTLLAHFRAGDISRGARILRAALDEGMRLGNDLTEYPFRRRAEGLLEQRKGRDALPFAAMAVEFAPLSWRSHVTVAEVLRRLRRPESARRAQRIADALNPTR